MNQSCNEKPIDLDFFRPLSFSLLFFSKLERGESVFRIEFIIPDAFFLSLSLSLCEEELIWSSGFYATAI